MTPDQLQQLHDALGQAIAALIEARDAIEPDPEAEAEEETCAAAEDLGTAPRRPHAW